MFSHFPAPTQINNMFSAHSKTNREGTNKSPSSLIRFCLGDAAPSKCGAVAVGIDKKRGGVELGETTPKHVAVIMDGNRRWARERGLSAQHGYRAGEKVIIQLALNCMNHGARVLSLFSFSTENMFRHEEEVDLLFGVMEEIYTSSALHELITKNDMRVSFIGNRKLLPLSLQEAMHAAEGQSKANKGMHLIFATNYSGRYDITEATKRIATKVKDGILQVDDINDTLFEQHLVTNVIDDFPNPDLLIRTSGELRISNYMLWQLAYAEMFFCDKLFPDFDNDDLVRAITSFQQRQRRFGAI